MEVRKDFAKRVAALSSSTPREAIANLLSALMPRVPAKTRAPEHPMGGDYPTPVPAPRPMGYDPGREPVSPVDPLDKLQRRAGRAPRTRKSFRAYEVLDSNAARNHKRGTWTHAMVSCIVANQTALAANTSLRLEYPEYAHKSLDFGWAAERGYIKTL